MTEPHRMVHWTGTQVDLLNEQPRFIEYVSRPCSPVDRHREAARRTTMLARYAGMLETACALPDCGLVVELMELHQPGPSLDCPVCAEGTDFPCKTVQACVREIRRRRGW